MAMDSDYLDRYIEQGAPVVTGFDEAVKTFLDEYVPRNVHVELMFETLYRFTIPDEHYRMITPSVDVMLTAMGLSRYICVNWDAVLYAQGIDVLEVWGKQIVVRRRMGLPRPDHRCEMVLDQLRAQFHMEYIKFLKTKGVQVR